MRAEDRMQAQLFEWLGLQYPDVALHVIHVPNGRDAGSARAGGIWKKLGVRKGVSDVLCFWRSNGYAGLAIELKVKPNRPDDDQLEWLALLEGQGWDTRIAYSLDEAIGFFRTYLS